MKTWTAPKLCKPNRHAWKKRGHMKVCTKCGQTQLALEPIKTPATV